ncbi:zinc-binding dehydrogenase [Actinoallomurus sp. NPDC052274]|uniref:zinc-binding dehydrogenase n=1 Tax=Actinoallomurus sp. NPDC052274 TaxID=3155420 RepID=UPI0034182DF0
MRALVATGDADLVGFAQVPMPAAGQDEVLVDVRAVSVNRGELHRILDAVPGWRPGWDFAGVIAGEAASGAGPPTGTRVFGIAHGQSWAEHLAVPLRQLAVIPNGVSWEQAAALPTAALTALRMLRLAGDLYGRTVLVTGAAGGVGRFAVQLARAAGAKVTGIVGRPDRAYGLDALGADDVHVGMGGVTPGFDLILESAGGDSLAQAFTLVAPGGMIVCFGNSARATTRFSVSDFYPKQAILRGYYVLDALDDDPPSDDLSDLVAQYALGTLRAGIATVVDWREAGAALKGLCARRLPGKTVLRVSA